MRERVLFVGAVKQRRSSFISLCRAFGITEKTGYKWWNRFERDGIEGLADESRSPHGNSRAICLEVAERCVELRKLRPTWGPRKIVAWLNANEPSWELPAASTVGELLKKRGLVAIHRERKRRGTGRPRSAPLSHADSPNAVWSMDFKGWVRLGDRTRCDPLTITDNYSRFLLRCSAVDRQLSKGVWKTLAATFREFGMPAAIRVDNGQPWVAAKGQLHLTALAVKILRLSITLERIARGKPQENGRHERFHLTLHQDVTRAPASSLRTQQREFRVFRAMYNEERPHEALGDRTPASFYRPSSRRFPGKLPEPEYPSWCVVERLTSYGALRFGGGTHFASTALRGQRVGLYEVEEGCHEVWFCTELLGHVHDAHPDLGIIPLGKPLPMSSV